MSHTITLRVTIMNDQIKRNATITATIVTNEQDSRPRALHLKFANGQELAITASQLTNHVMEYAIFHGLKQKLVDAAAISRNPETGRAASVEDKYQAVKTVYDRLLAGAWNATREGVERRADCCCRHWCACMPDGKRRTS